MKILIAVDGSPISDAAVMEAAKRPWPPGSEVKIISVAEWPTGPGVRETLPPNMLAEFERTARDRAEGIADRAITTFREHESQVIPISKAVALDSAKDAIIEEAAALGRRSDRRWLARLSRLQAVSTRIGVASCRCAGQMLGRDRAPLGRGRMKIQGGVLCIG